MNSPTSMGYILKIGKQCAGLALEQIYLLVLHQKSQGYSLSEKIKNKSLC